MAVRHLSPNVFFVDLPLNESQIVNELENINKIISDRNDCDVIIDFTRVEVIISSSISNLMILRDMLHNYGHRLVLCNVNPVTKCIFTVAGIADIFDFADDKSDALASLANVPNSAPQSDNTN